ncbi:probable cell wall protein PGA41 isoform X1 [Ananas comosus]|uniref:Probable cell wall protein PGA41 isoform X1 n=1 Tax=Ananas comosus TaxID=4615 RepID=A0A6P5G1L3_ANACO|nr:probable cell wall protein PGA41 isoform X1 [Ananas comosus]
MGNCQAAEAATVVIQHPGGKTERVYWSVAASQVMAANPGHYVALIITTLPSSSSSSSSFTALPSSIRSSSRSSTTAVKHLKLLRPADTLRIGHTYRLVSFEEVLREFASTKRQVKLSRLLVKHKEKPASRRSSSSSDGSGGGGGSNSRGCKIRSSSTDDSGNDTSSNSRCSKDCSGGGYRDEQHSRSQVNEPESSPATDQAAESSTQPSTEKEAETDQELELVVRAMMGGGGMTTVLRRGHWRPTLQSIAEGVGN